jgi:hypothetical protein
MDEPTTPLHYPELSPWPLLVACGLAMIAAGVLSSLIVSAAGLALLLFSVAGWTAENRRQAQMEEAAHE